MQKLVGLAILPLALGALAGCVAQASDADAPPVGIAEGESPHRVVLADETRTYEAPMQFGPASMMQPAFAVANVPVESGLRAFDFQFVRSHSPGAVVGDRCRIVQGDEVIAQARFGMSEGAGLVTSADVCWIHVWHLAPGTYTAEYVLDEVAPMSEHNVHLRVEADLEPWRPAQQ